MNKMKGFTLVEIAIALVIIGILVGGGVKLFGINYQVKKSKQTQAQLLEIKSSLLTYVKINGYLPCPDKITGTHSGDGEEDRKSNGACSTREGYLPGQTLGINSQDAWSQPFYYRVNARAEDIDRVTDICQSASVFGAIKSSGGVPRTKSSDFAMCPDNQMYYCQECNDVCSDSCDFTADPRPYEDKPPYFHTSTQPIGMENDGFKNLIIKNEKGEVVDELQVAVVVSFGSNGRETWADPEHCPSPSSSSLSNNEEENCNNDAIFISSRNQSVENPDSASEDNFLHDDYVIGVSLRDVKRAMIETGLKDY